jgi:hypothetical protein
VPKDLKLVGNKGEFIIRVTYDTLELYGKVQASRKFTVAWD